MSVKMTFEGTVTRIYEEERGQHTNKYLVVTDDGGKYPNVLRFNLKPDAAAPCGENDKVKVSAYINGREWTNNEGKTMYFTDFKVDTVEVLESAAPADKPKTAANWNELVALGAAYGEDIQSITNRCKAKHPGKAASSYTAADWQAVADEIVSAHAPATPAPDFGESEDMPF